MRIKQVEDNLGLDREAIRYYISEGLIQPVQRENKYREYGDEEIAQLKRILILRQLNVSVRDIGRIFDGKLDLKTALESSKKDLERKNVILSDAIDICKQLKENDADNRFDPDPYFKNYTKIFGDGE